MWKRYFKFVKLRPGKVVTALYGDIDFSADNLGIEILKTLFENDFPYLVLTEDGKAELYGLDTFIRKPKKIKIPNHIKVSQYNGKQI